MPTISVSHYLEHKSCKRNHQKSSDELEQNSSLFYIITLDMNDSVPDKHPFLDSTEKPSEATDSTVSSEEKNPSELLGILALGFANIVEFLRIRALDLKQRVVRVLHGDHQWSSLPLFPSPPL